LIRTTIYGTALVTPILFQEIRADVDSGHKIVATLFAECGAMYREDGPPELKSLGETEFVTAVAREGESGRYGSTRYIAGIIGYVDLRLGSRVKGVLEQHMGASDGRLRSIRNGAASRPDSGLKIFAGAPPGLLLNREFREGFAVLAPLGLSFDVWVLQTQLEEAVDLARAFPQTTLVLDHLGGPLAVGPYAGKREEAFTKWREGIFKVASCPNVYIKLGGLGMKPIGFTFYENDLPPSSEDLEKAWRPYIETCVEAFGPQRSMYESNFPVDKGTCSYRVLWNAFKRIAAGYSADEKTALFKGAALKAYWPVLL
jgi:L-fuconolactonase